MATFFTHADTIAMQPNEREQKLLRETREVWQRYSPTELTEDDAAEILRNTRNFLDALLAPLKEECRAGKVGGHGSEDGEIV